MYEELKQYITDIPDFPSEGIIFHDITSIIQNGESFKLAIDALYDVIKDIDFDVIAGIESRGFIFGAALAAKLNKGLVLVRKKGKLPRATVSEKYDLEYGQAEIEIHTDAIKKGQKVLVIDDLIATGGTVKAATKLIERLGGEVAATAFLIELKELGGRAALEPYVVRTVMVYEGR